jgi:Fusaric acid resistance protein-like
MLAILQTAVAAAVAWYLAHLLLPDPRPSFAAIAAVIAVGATHGQRAPRAFQLTGGVVLGVAVADLIVQLIGSGGWQLGVMVVLAMSTAVLIGGGELLVVEAGVSAILLVALDPGSAAGFSPNRIFEAMIGGATALAVTSIVFPPDPALGPGRAAQAVFVELGRALERIATALAGRDAAAGERALVDARDIDHLVRAVEEELVAGRETARYAPPRRAARVELDRYARSISQVDFAVRNTRVLARHALRLARERDVPARIPEAVRDLSQAVWELAASYDAPGHAAEARRIAVHAAARVTELDQATPDLTMVATQVRSVAVDLIRAADLVAGVGEPLDERPTEELLVAVAAS